MKSQKKPITVDMNECLDALQRASLWLRKEYNIPDNEIVTPYFEREFNAKINYHNSLEEMYSLSPSITFSTQAHYTLFLMKWS